VALERGVHGSVEALELARVFADEVRGEHGDSGAHAFGVGGEVGGAEGADFAVADEAGVGFDADEVLSKTVTDLPPDQL
jgi:hypothetical protein